MIKPICQYCLEEIPVGMQTPSRIYCSQICCDKAYRKTDKYKLRSRFNNKIHFQNNKQKHYDYIKKHREDNIAYKIRCNLAVRIYQALKGINKSKKTVELIGCSIKYLVDYIESQFDDEMSWSNYNRTGWHIDHIIPCYHFDLSKEEEQMKCFHHSNLQPLWAYDNFTKNRNIFKEVEGNVI